MIQIDPDKVCFIIEKAREFEAQVEPPDDAHGEDAGDDDLRSVLLAYPDNPTFDEMEAYIDSLNQDAQVELVALVWLGREDYTADDWKQALEDAADRHTGSTATYLLGIPMLADYLESGLAQFGFSCGE